MLVLGAGGARAADPRPVRGILDDRTFGALQEIEPGIFAGFGLYRGDTLFLAPYATVAAERTWSGYRWGAQAALFWLEGEPFIASNERDSTIRTFLSTYYTAPFGTVYEGDSPVGPIRSSIRLGGRLELEHVLPDLSLGGAWSTEVSLRPDLRLYAHLVPAIALPDVDHDLASSRLDVILAPQPSLRIESGLRLLDLGPLGAVDVRGILDRRPLGSDWGWRLGLRSPWGVDAGATLLWTEAHGGSVRRRILELEAIWTLPVRPDVGGEILNVDLGLSSRSGEDRFGTVEEDVLEIRGFVRMRWGPGNVLEGGSRVDQGSFDQDVPAFEYSEGERAFLGALDTIRDASQQLITELTAGLEDLQANPRPPGPEFLTLVDRTSNVLALTGLLLTVLPDALENASPQLAGLIEIAAARVLATREELEAFLADPSDPDTLENILEVIEDVRNGLQEGLDATILQDTTVDQLITRILFEPDAFVEEVAAEELNDLLRQLDEDEDFGFLFEEVDDLLMIDWKTSKTRDLEPVSREDVVSFFIGEVTGEIQALVNRGLGELVAEFEEDPEGFLSIFAPVDRPAIAQLMLDLGELSARDILPTAVLANAFPRNTLTTDTAQTLANLINQKVLVARKAFTDFRKRVAVREGLPLDRILIEDVEDRWASRRLRTVGPRGRHEFPDPGRIGE